MIQRLASKIPDRLPMRGAACEHQRRLGRRVLAKNRKHLALVVVAEVKETVPRKDTGNVRCKASRRMSAGACPRRSIPASENAFDRHRSSPGTNPRQRRDDPVRSGTRPLAQRIRSRDRGSGQPEAATPRSGRARAFRAAWCVRDSRSSPTPCAGTDQ